MRPHAKQGAGRDAAPGRGQVPIATSAHGRTPHRSRHPQRKHSQQRPRLSQAKPTYPNSPAQQPCRRGDKCGWWKKGTCLFQHDSEYEATSPTFTIQGKGPVPCIRIRMGGPDATSHLDGIALVDSCSEYSYIRPEAAAELGLSPRQVQAIRIIGFGGTQDTAIHISEMVTITVAFKHEGSDMHTLLTTTLDLDLDLDLEFTLAPLEGFVGPQPQPVFGPEGRQGIGWRSLGEIAGDVNPGLIRA
eukprot:Amastigsp_a842122_88.p1 type:complete len:245 gc:universal Amastigsp_a842122_88:84-818(+)